ncbi:CPBP family intramembrane glutamic endopeptidase [Cognatishimia sp. F0-27]|uniref:CPBP family intramembrane glutamic endopeptidase n=1 Tax=Cognatishimia sp. F0-27 TaxID=2816855 RepID=UPI001D0C7955|nr:type II CAAX endopeptidase family protein [Cognatishimia sp. F0-27]MCC1493027.1 CPBP family intramembrane metalloprotease [Cognatishimia sp. F0-27]
MTAYRPFRLLTDPARPSAALWRLTLGLLVALVVMFGLSRAVLALARASLEDDSYWALVAALERADTPLGLLGLLTIMGAMGVGALVACEHVHRRPVSTLFGPLRLFRRQFLVVALAVSMLHIGVAILPPWPHAQTLQPGLPPTLWVSLLPLTLVALLIQTGSEELLFRGYLQSQLGARFAHPVVWLSVPSALFALGHYAPEVYGENALAVMLWAGAFGLAAADLTARAGSLGPAIALHLVNNIAAIALVSLSGEMSGLALYRLPFGADDSAAIAAILPADLAMIGLSWLTARIALAR